MNQAISSIQNFATAFRRSRHRRLRQERYDRQRRGRRHSRQGQAHLCRVTFSCHGSAYENAARATASFRSRPGDPQQSLQPMHTRGDVPGGEPDTAAPEPAAALAPAPRAQAPVVKEVSRSGKLPAPKETAKPAVIQVPVLATSRLRRPIRAVKPAAARTSEHERVQDPRKDRRQDARQSASRFGTRQDARSAQGLAARRTPRAARTTAIFSGLFDNGDA